MSNKGTPAHDVWVVQRRTSDKGFLSIIGAGWQHEDDFGMSLKLNLLPIADQEVVIRRVKQGGSVHGRTAGGRIVVVRVVRGRKGVAPPGRPRPPASTLGKPAA
jgi:hypothetical protein